MSRHRKIGLALLGSAVALLVGVELLRSVGKAATLAGIVTVIGLAFSALVLWIDETQSAHPAAAASHLELDPWPHSFLLMQRAPKDVSFAEHSDFPTLDPDAQHLEQGRAPMELLKP